ncbi:MAG: hypothetical protein ABSE59_05520 [Opitutaceae bacterium]
MSAHAYTEDQLVEQPAIGLFAEVCASFDSKFHTRSLDLVGPQGLEP